MITVFHNPRCKKSRDGLNYLKSKAVPFAVREYLKDPVTPGELEEILLKTGLKPVDLVRKQDASFRKELKGKHFTDEEWKRILLADPKLLVRPIVVGRYKAVVALDPERIREVLKEVL